MLQKVPCAVNPLNTAELTPQILLPSENRVRIQLQRLELDNLSPRLPGKDGGLPSHGILKSQSLEDA